eukprot:scaffold651343_cov41-Prasinocladus_malaysianus.AAC.1
MRPADLRGEEHDGDAILGLGAAQEGCGGEQQDGLAAQGPRGAVPAADRRDGARPEALGREAHGGDQP